MSLGLRRPCEHGMHAPHRTSMAHEGCVPGCRLKVRCPGGSGLSDAEALRLILDTHREALVQDAAEGWDTETVPSLVDALVAAVEVEEASNA